MEFTFNDGGRAAAGFKGQTRDCVTRAIAIVTELPYIEVYDNINKYCKARKKCKGNSRTGVFKQEYNKYLNELGYTWQPTMSIGSGCKVHLRSDELPTGRLIVRVSGHMVAVINGVINDTQDCSRNENRCVYGYFYKS
jgi:hypothetical protein